MVGNAKICGAQGKVEDEAAVGRTQRAAFEDWERAAAGAMGGTKEASRVTVEGSGGWVGWMRRRDWWGLLIGRENRAGVRE